MRVDGKHTGVPNNLTSANLRRLATTLVRTEGIEIPAEFGLHFREGKNELLSHQVPATVLTQSLAGIQRIVHLIAMHHEQREFKTRARVAKDIEQRFPLMCQVPITGSYELPITLGAPTRGLFYRDAVRPVAIKFKKVLGALSAGNLTRLRELVPDASYRRNISRAARDALPSPRTGFQFSILNSDRQCLFDAHDALPHIEEALQHADDPVEVASVVTGKFSQVDFDARKLKIRYLVTNTMLDCHYEDDIEPLLLNNPRELIQVVGDVELNADDNPVRVTKVQAIIKVDLSPITVGAIKSDKVLLAARQPIALKPVLSETKQFYKIYREDLGISVIAFTRRELIDILHEEISILWEEYVQADDHKLTLEAKELKRQLQQAFEERK